MKDFLENDFAFVPVSFYPSAICKKYVLFPVLLNVVVCFHSASSRVTSLVHRSAERSDTMSCVHHKPRKSINVDDQRPARANNTEVTSK
jgi:hypothetical protein